MFHVGTICLKCAKQYALKRIEIFRIMTLIVVLNVSFFKTLIENSQKKMSKTTRFTFFLKIYYTCIQIPLIGHNWLIMQVQLIIKCQIITFIFLMTSVVCFTEFAVQLLSHVSIVAITILLLIVANTYYYNMK